MFNMKEIKNMFINFFNNIKILLSEILCSHNWRYWHVKLSSDKRSLDGTILRNKYRRCKKCNKQQSFKMIPKNSRWDPSSMNLPENKDIINVSVKQIGTESKQEKRDKLLSKILDK